MTATASTRPSLLVRIRNTSDTEAWTMFTQIYGPLIQRFASRHGLQDADAADLTQEVLGQVAKAIARFQYDPQIGRFRSWLFTVAQHTLNRMRSRLSREPVGTGDSAIFRSLNNLPAALDSTFWSEYYEMQLFDWAVSQVRPKCQEVTWNAFWMTAVEGRPAQDVADELSLSIGSVYVAKNRVIKRLKTKIAQVDGE